MEHVGLDPVLFLWLILGRARGARVMYASGHSGLVGWWQRRYPQGYFDEIVCESFQTGEAPLRLYDLMEKNAGTWEHSYVTRALLQFFPHPQIARTLRRLLMQYIFSAWALGLEVERLRDRDERVRFFPACWRALVRDHGRQAWGCVPRGYAGYLFARRWVDQVLFPFLAAIRNVLMAVRGRGLSLVGPTACTWAIAQKMDANSLKTRMANHELIYGEGELRPGRILHLIDERDADPESMARLQAEGGAPVCVGLLKMPLGYFLTRVVWAYLLRFALPCSLAAGASPQGKELFRAAIRIGWQVVNFEVLAMHHRPRVYFGWDTYSVDCSVRTMVLEQIGTRCIGYIHGSPPAPQPDYFDVYVHVLLVAGRRLLRAFGRTLDMAGRIEVIGHMHTELVLGRGNKPRRPKHFTVAFDTSYSPKWGGSRSVLRAFYDGLIGLVDKYPDLELVLKRKYDTAGQFNPAYAEVQSVLEAHPRITVQCEQDTYSLIDQADSVIAVTVSTTGVEALACRKPTLFFDPRPNYEHNPYRQYHPFLVCHTAEELHERYNQILAGDYPPDIFESVVSQESRFYEERSLSLVQSLLLAEAGETLTGRPWPIPSLPGVASPA